MAYQLWLADVLRREGLPVREIPGWQQRGHGAMGQVLGVMCHHTAGPAHGNYPSEQVVVHGRPGLAGPLANLGLARDGTWIVVAAGQAWHAGRGHIAWCPRDQGNTHCLGVEAESQGTVDDWTDAQRGSYPRGVAALLTHLGLGSWRAIGHKEWSPGRKIDPAFWDMHQFRAQVASWMASPAKPSPHPRPQPTGDDPVHAFDWPAGVGAHKLVCPVGAASQLVSRAWLSLACDGDLTFDIWFHSDTDALADFHGDTIKDQRVWWELPSGCTQVVVHYTATGPVGACLEVQPR